MNDRASSNGESTGRAIQSSYNFPLANFLTKPAAFLSGSNSYTNNYNANNNEKAGRFIVYPSYTPNNGNNIDQTRRGYDKAPSTGM